MHQEVKVRGDLKEGYLVENSMRAHVILADQPISADGSDVAPTPTEMLLSSLISCKLITIRMYATHKNWDLKNASIELKMAGSSEKTAIHKTIEFEGKLSKEQKNRLITVSERCPLARMLKNSIEFNSL
ncbi:OsmC family protein [Crocinitomicaceae bacterium]|nr:OsmC family protein [Crocinitomicaceae bacterium]